MSLFGQRVALYKMGVFVRLSFSKLSRFESCPLAYKFHYVDKLPSEPSVPLLFGSAIHEVLEKLIQEHVEEELVGPLSKARAEALWQTVWSDTELSGVEVFQEGLDILYRFVNEQKDLDHLDVLAVEQPIEFTLPGDFQVIGYIDRVDRIDDETIEVIDYKTSRQLYSSEEVNKSLQLSLYQIAAQQLWPWAKKIRLSYWMLRHGVKQSAERPPHEIYGVKKYVVTLGQQIRATKEFRPKLNVYCGNCDYRQHCPAYKEALTDNLPAHRVNFGNLEEVSRERESVSNRVRILNSRKSELEKPLRAALRGQEDIVLGETRYSMLKTTRKTYSARKTLEALARVGISKETVLDTLLMVDNKALREFLKAHPIVSPSQAHMLEVELEASAKCSYSSRICAKPVMP